MESFSLWTVIAEELKQETPAAPNKSGPPEQCILQCTGDLSAQVALLQSPILSVAKHPTPKKKFSEAFPLTNHIPVHLWLDSLQDLVDGKEFDKGFRMPAAAFCYRLFGRS